jgi:hypothetical protein
MIYIPDYHWEMGKKGFRFVNLKSILIVLGEDRIHIFKKAESEMSADTIRFSDISCVERGCILLFSWIKIYSDSREPMPSIEFNTTVEIIFDRVIEKLRLNYYDSVDLGSGSGSKPVEH